MNKIKKKTKVKRLINTKRRSIIKRVKKSILKSLKVLPQPYVNLLNLYKTAMESGTQLRFGRSTIPISRIVNQFYCEQKFEFTEQQATLLNNEAIKLSDSHELSKQKGDEGHTADLPFVEHKTEDEIWIAAFQKNRKIPVSIREFHGLFKFDGFYINGSIDSAVFHQGKALSVSEFKFRPSLRLYDTDRIQGNLYGLLLQNLGFDTSELIIRLICFNSNDREVALLTNKYFPDDGNSLKEEFKFNSSEANDKLVWALQYWKSEREALKTTHIGKCRKCEYSLNCRNNKNPLQMELPL